MSEPISFLETAKRRWPTYRIRGEGRYAIATAFDGVVRLYETYTIAVADILDPRYAQVTDLGGMTGEELFDKIPDRYDADERRREHREKTAEKFRARY